MDLFQAFALLFAGSVALLAGLALLVVSRKALRDRRESKSARRRRHYRRALATGDPLRLRRVLGTVRDREQQVDLAFVLQDDSAPRPPVEVLDREGRRSGLTVRLQEQLRARNGPARGRAVLILAHLRLPEGVTRLEPMLDDEDPDVRLVAVAGLPLAEDPDAVPALVRALGHAGDPRAEPAMIDLLQRGSLEERISAARALGAVGGRRARPELERALADEAWPLRAQAAKALGSIGIKKAVPALEAVLDDPAWWVRANAAAGLRALGAPGHKALERALDHPDRYARDRAREALAMDRVGVGA
ncbi:MAG TPA: HEAT repeat domain-containing protein [Solirubrobacteraceae bacterium]|nr:HEAT repeat domain-containing protein [Solirubrobacteraceae bacterium]